MVLFSVDYGTIKFFEQADNGVGAKVAEVIWKRKWNGRIKLTVQYVSPCCGMCDLLTALDGAIAAIKLLSRTVG